MSTQRQDSVLETVYNTLIHGTMTHRLHLVCYIVFRLLFNKPQKQPTPAKYPGSDSLAWWIYMQIYVNNQSHMVGTWPWSLQHPTGVWNPPKWREILTWDAIIWGLICVSRITYCVKVGCFSVDWQWRYTLLPKIKFKKKIKLNKMLDHQKNGSQHVKLKYNISTQNAEYNLENLYFTSY